MVDMTASATAPKPTTPISTPVQAPAAVTGDPSKSSNAKVIQAPFQIKTYQSRQLWLKALFYGKHGAGKTELAATAVDCPEMRDVLIISAESGLMTIEDSPRVKNFQDIQDITVTTFKQVAHIHEFLTAYCKAREAGNLDAMRKLYCQVTDASPEQVPNPPQFKTVIIDSLTEVEAYCTYGILGLDQAKIMSGDMDVAGWPEFRKNNEMVKMLCRAFRDLPMHVIFICAEQYTQDEMKRYHYTPALTGKLSGQVQGFMDIVGWITVGPIPEGKKEAPRRVYIQPVGGANGMPKFDAKNRRPVYAEAYFDNPSMNSIMELTGLK